MSDPDRLPRHVIRLAEARHRDAVPFDLAPDDPARKALAEELGLIELRKLRFQGRLTPEGKQDWRLEASLGATVVQESVVTLEPVTTRIDEAVTRRYLAAFEEPEAGEHEMPDDDTAEALPAALDLGAVMIEALALALPDFPRAEGEELGELVVSEPGTEPLTEEKAKPFSALLDALKPRE